MKLRDGIIRLGTKRAISLGFCRSCFQPYSYLWKQGDRIIISMISSTNERKGNLKRLFDKIENAGFRVCVPTPLGRMQDILIKNGYKPFREDTANLGPVDVWMKPIHRRGKKLLTCGCITYLQECKRSTTPSPEKQGG